MKKKVKIYKFFHRRLNRWDSCLIAGNVYYVMEF